VSCALIGHYPLGASRDWRFVARQAWSPLVAVSRATLRHTKLLRAKRHAVLIPMLIITAIEN